MTCINCEFFNVATYIGSNPGGGVLPYLGYTGTCHWTGYGFWLASVPNRFKTCPEQGMVCEQSLSFLRLRPGPCEKLKKLAIERRTSNAFLFLICIRSTEWTDHYPDITMSSINIRSFFGQEYYCGRYLNLKYFCSSAYYTKLVLTEQIVPVPRLIGRVSLNSCKTSECAFCHLS